MNARARVLLGWQAADDEVALAARQLPDAEVLAVPPHPSISRYDCAPDAMEAAAADVDVILAWGVSNSVLRRLTKLRLLAWLHSGVDPVDAEVLAERGIALTNVAGANADAVAEHAFALTLALAKRIPERHARVRDGLWAPIWEPATAGMLLSGGTLVVVGVGAVGRRVAEIGRAFGMRVVGVRKSGSPDEVLDEVHPPSGLADALAQADVAVLSVPLTGTTERMIGAAELAAMPRHALLVNVCRGRVVDEPALKAALDGGEIAGFGSDVWWFYPHHLPEGWHYAVPSRLGIHRHERAIVTGDHACDLMPVRDRMIGQGVANVRAFLDGRTPPNLLFDGERWHRRP